jgi:hypothetical protein
MSNATFDAEKADRLYRIRTNPNPRSLVGLIRAFIAWGRSLERERAFDALKGMFGIMGAAGYAGYIASMHFVLALVSLIGMAGTWYAVYVALGKRV